MKRSKSAWGLRAAAVVMALAGSALALGQELPTDPSLVTGELDNGMKYIVKRHGNPPGRAAMWIHVSTGSLNETDTQRGLAHFLEHMAFNGSENFPPGSVISFFEGMGLTFGQHQNAFTSFDQTTYQLAFPDNKPETIEKGMRFFADVAGRLSLLQTEIDEERQVILEEKRARSGAEQRLSEKVLEQLIPGSIIGQRLPIGVEETLTKMNRDEFASYYSKWYVPSNMTIMVVADADPEPIVEEIREQFSGGDKVPVPVDVDPGVKPYTQTRAIVATDPEYTKAEVSVIAVGPKQEPALTEPLARRDLVQDLAQDAFNRRIGAKMNRGDTAYVDAGASASNLFNAAMLRQVSAEGKPEDWRTLLRELGEDVQRARLHGFSEQEVEDLRRETIASLEQLVAQESTMPARIVLSRMNRSVAVGEPVMSAQQRLDLARKHLPGITAEEVSRTFAELFEPRNVTFVAQLPSSADVPSEDELVRLGTEAFSVTPDKQADEERPTALLEQLPEPGRIVESATHEVSGVTSVWLSNGVRVHHRFMDDRKEQARVEIVLAAGTLQETDKDRGVSDAAGLAWGRPATSRLSSTNIRDLMVGKKADVRGGAGFDVLSLSVNANPSDLEEGMKLAYLMLTDPVIEPAALEQWKKETLQAIERRKSDPRAAMAEVMAETIYPAGDARVRPLTAEQVERITLEAAQSWLRNAIATAPMEVSVVGDISRERAMELVTRYLGSLPARQRISGATLDDLRKMDKKPGPRMIERRVPTQTDMAMVASGFYGADLENTEDVRLMSMASRIMSTRMIKRIREQEQLAYSPGAGHRPGTDFPGFGMFAMATPTEPAKVERLLSSADDMFKSFAADGPTEEEMTTVKKQVAAALDEQMKDPSFWTARLTTLDYRSTRVDDIVNAQEAYQGYTAEQVRSTFAKYYKPEAVFKVVVRPEAEAGQ